MGIEDQGEGIWRWTSFEQGRKYFLGTHHGGLGGFNGDDVYGTYIGQIQDIEGRDRHVFIRPEENVFHSYSSLEQKPLVEWHGAGCDDPVFPSVKVSYDGRVPQGRTKEAVRQRLQDLL